MTDYKDIAQQAFDEPAKETGEYQVAAQPDVGVMILGPMVWKGNALTFKRQLTHDEVEQFVEGLEDFRTGHQLMYADLWNDLDSSGIDWTQYIPERIAKNTAMNWFNLPKRFAVDYRRTKNHVTVSHYIAASGKKLTDEQAVQLIDYADDNKWTVEKVELAVKEALGIQEKVPKPKVIQCAHCDNWIAKTDKGCGWCFYTIAQQRIESFQAILTELANPSGDLEWAVELASRALAEV